MKLFSFIISFIYLLPNSVSAQTSCDTIYEFAETLPQYKKDNQDQFDYIMDELAPIISDCIKRDGHLIANLRTIFTIDKTGNIIDVHFQQSALSEQCRKELTAKVLTMKGWTPGLQNGNPVCAKAYWPINCINWQ